LFLLLFLLLYDSNASYFNKLTETQKKIGGRGTVIRRRSFRKIGSNTQHGAPRARPRAGHPRLTFSPCRFRTWVAGTSPATGLVPQVTGRERLSRSRLAARCRSGSAPGCC